MFFQVKLQKKYWKNLNLSFGNDIFTLPGHTSPLGSKRSDLIKIFIAVIDAPGTRHPNMDKQKAILSLSFLQ